MLKLFWSFDDIFKNIISSSVWIWVLNILGLVRVIFLLAHTKEQGKTNGWEKSPFPGALKKMTF